MKDTPQETFRWAAHTGGLAVIKMKDYEAGEEVEAPSPYAAWKRLAEDGESLRPGDVLEALEPGTGSTLQIAKYVGFEPAKWFIPEPKPEALAGDEACPVNVVGNKEDPISGNPA